MTRKEELCAFYGVNPHRYDPLWTITQMHYDTKLTFTSIMEKIKENEKLTQREFNMVGAIVYGLRSVENIVRMSGMKMKAHTPIKD